MKVNLKPLTFSFILTLLLFSLVPFIYAQDEAEPAEIENDEGGPVRITGEVAYTNPFFTLGVASPVVILEDQAGFVDRNRGFVMTEQSQALGQITTDFFTSPFSYSLALPIRPQGEYRDVDNDSEDDQGVQIFAVAYWTNVWGDPFLEERDLFGGGWSTAYASTLVDPSSEVGEAGYEYTGGKLLVYAPDDEQGFPSGFGEDGFLFTDDDPTVILPQGYTVVDMDTDPFTFDRSSEVTINLLEGEGAEADDFSGMGYAEAFDAMIDKMSNEYAFTEYKEIDWEALREEFRPRFEEAEANSDNAAYRRALMEFAWAIPDGHIGTSAFISEDFAFDTAGGLGLAIRELDDERVIVNFLLDGGPADEAGIEMQAEILEINGEPIQDVLDANVPWSSPFGTDHVRRLQQLRYVVRFPADTEVELTYQNPGDEEPTTTTLMTVPERESFNFSSFNIGLAGDELPVEYELLDSGYVYAKIYSFSDNDVLTIQLWERMIQFMNDNGIPGLIIDMRQNGGGSGFLADQMAAYFFDEPLELGNTGYYDEDAGEFIFDENLVDQLYPPAEDLRYYGSVAVLVGPNCNSACEFFSYDMTLQDRAAIVGQYPTGGLGGSVEQFFMPDGEVFQFTIGRAVGAEGEIHIEGIGVVPTVDVPVDEETLFAEGDPILEAAIEYLDSETSVEIIDGGTIEIGDTVEGELAEQTRVQYMLDIPADTVLDITVSDETGELDTYLRIYVAGDTAPAVENDDSEVGDTVNSALLGLEVPGGLSLIVEVGGFDDAASGSFTLSVQEAEASDS